jgi:hypothetical protein
MHALIETARLNGVDPEACLSTSSDASPTIQSIASDELLPWNWSPFPAQAKAA